MSENRELQRMYEYKELKGNAGSEYAVRGAELSCSYGGKTCVLNLPRDHSSYTLDGRPLITVSDTKPENIKGFSTCKVNKRNSYRCELKLGTWSVVSNKDMKIKDPATGKIEYAVECSATALCLKGGVVKFKTSGQTSPSYDNTKSNDTIEIAEDVSGNWTRKSDNKDFLGHVKIEHSGIYKFNIVFNDRIDINRGSVFIYRKIITGKIVFVGAFKLENILQEEDSIRYFYIDVALDKGVDYYFEIDTPNVDKIEFVLKGNLDTHRLRYITTEKKEISGVWIINREHENIYPNNYENIVKENNHGVTRGIYYLDSWYAILLQDLIDEIIVTREIPQWINNIVNGASIAIGAKWTEAGVLLSSIMLIIDNIYDIDWKLFSSKLRKAKSENKCIKIEIRSNYYADRWIYDADTQIIGHNYYHYNFSGYSELDIGRQLEGAKYERGSFELLHNFNSDADPRDLINKLKNSSNIEEMN